MASSAMSEVVRMQQQADKSKDSMLQQLQRENEELRSNLAAAQNVNLNTFFGKGPGGGGTQPPDRGRDLLVEAPAAAARGHRGTSG